MDIENIIDLVIRTLTELFQNNEISDQDGFLELGGTSVMALRFSAKLYEQFGVKIPPRELLENLNSAGIAKIIHAASSDTDSSHVDTKQFRI